MRCSSGKGNGTNINCKYALPVESWTNFACNCIRSNQQINFVCACKSRQHGCDCFSPQVTVKNVKCDISNKRVISVGVMLPMAAKKMFSLRTGSYYASAMFIARDDINADKTLLQNYTLNIEWKNTECNATKSILQQLYFTRQGVDALVFGGCRRQECLTAARISRAINKPMMSHVSID